MTTPRRRPRRPGRTTATGRSRSRTPRRRARARARVRPRVRPRIGGGLALVAVLVAMSWSSIWPYAVGALALAAATVAIQWFRRTDHRIRDGDRRWRHDDALRAGHRSLAEIDTMTGTEFEECVAALCRRDGCTEVRRVGGSHDNGADVLGRLPDGRSMVIQCKRHTPRKNIPSREVRDLLGAKVHFEADVAIFVTTTFFTGPAEDFAARNAIVAIHRDHLGQWNNGASLPSLTTIGASGQGDRHHRRRRRETYG
ncbi:restriction endonuclease [Streptomyces sp. NPDC058953]|uniref:restriction endonuclease n=1 Tax=unclassified Streptomyces TaxID=2593676 RepID=UPI0036BFECBF